MRVGGQPVRGAKVHRGGMEITGSPIFREVATAYDWGIDLMRWFSMPPFLRAMMIAYSETVATVRAMLTPEEVEWSGPSRSWRSGLSRS